MITASDQYLKYAEDRISKCAKDCVVPDDMINQMLLEVSVCCKDNSEIVEYCKERIEYYKKILVINKLSINKNMVLGRSYMSEAAAQKLDIELKDLLRIEKEAEKMAAYWTLLMEAKNG